MNLKNGIRRSLTLAAIGGMSLAVASIGIATAANGGSLTLGHHNTATKTTTLADKKGTPLSLVGKKSKPPLTVNSSKLVKHLNAAELNGATSSDLSSGSGGHLDTDLLNDIGGGGTIEVISLPPVTGSGSSETFSPILLVRTGALKAGTYSVNANALSTGDTICFVGTNGTFPGVHQYGVQGTSSTSSIFSQDSETDYLTVTQGQTIGEYCLNGDSSDPAYVVADSLSATRVNSSIAGHQTQPSALPAERVRRSAQ